ncbi:hypothetical protein PGB90_008597 [Kerria lacca]
MGEKKSIKEEWKKIKQAISTAARNKIGIRKVNKKKSWMQEKVLELMEERRKYKAREEDAKRKYNKTLRNKIKGECKKEKEKWVSKNFEKIEEQMKTGRAN